MILGLDSIAYAQQLEIDADSFEGETETQIRAKNVRLRYKDNELTASEILYDQESGWLQAEGLVKLTDGNNNRLQADLLEYFPLLSRAIVRGDAKFIGDDGLQLWAHTIRYEIEMRNLLLEGNMHMLDNIGNKLSAEILEYDLDQRHAVVKGNVKLETNSGETITTNELSYSEVTQQLQVVDNISFTDQQGNVITGKNFDYNIASNTGSFDEITLRGEVENSTLVASTLKFADDKYLLNDILYTTCKIDDPAWLLEAESVELVEQKAVHAKNVTFNFYGVPVFYLPQMSYSLSKERRSGFLAPTFSISDDSEFSLTTPYYLNLAPNYDALIAGSYYSAHGLHMSVNGRWLFTDGVGHSSIGMINDNDTNKFRSNWSIFHVQQLGNGFQAAIDASGISDDGYQDDFFTGAEAAKRQYLRQVKLEQSLDDWNWGIAINSYQTIQKNSQFVTKPYAQIPSINANWSAPIDGLEYSVAGRVDNFYKKGDQFNAWRTNLQGEVAKDISYKIHSLRLAAGVAGSKYSYKSSDSQWAVPFVSADLRPRFISSWQYGDVRLRQILEPRLFVGLVNGDDFDNTPIYDSARVDADYQDYFSINPFVGGDRFQDTNFISYGLGSRLWLPTQDEVWLSGRIAQRYLLEDSKIALGNQTPATKGFSNFIAELKFNPNRNNNYLARLEWNPDTESVEQADLTMQHLSDYQHVYWAQYSRNTTDTTATNRGEIGLGVHRIVSNTWQVVADLNYDLDNRDFTEVNAGIRFTSECRCWGFDFFVEHEPLATKDKTTYFLQIDLSGLGEFGSDNFDNLAKRLATPL